MSVLIECVELSIHRSAKGFRAGFKGFESSIVSLERFGKMRRIKWGFAGEEPK